MANTYVDYTATAAQTDFAFSFDYLEDEHVEVFIDGTKKTLTTDYTIVTSPSTKIVLTVAATGGESIRVRRNSDPSTDLVDFVNGSVLTETELDRAYQHNRYLNEEAFEGNQSSLQTVEGGTDFDANFNKIVNLGTPTNSTDAVHKNYVDTLVALDGTSLSGFNKSVHTGDNTTTQFTLSFTAQTATAAAFRVTVDGSVQTPDTDYTVETGTNQITFTSAPALSTNVVVVPLGTAQDVNSVDVTASGGGATKSISDWTADIETNASNISTNTSNISTNTSNISTNTSNITSKSAMVSRPAMQYKDGTSVYFKGLKEVSMCGFRFQGLYEKQAGKKFSISGDYPSASFSTDLEYQSSLETREWYGIFAVADDGDANAVFKIVPFLQAKSVAGSVVTLNQVIGADATTAGRRLLSGHNYNWSDDALNDAECLVITETVDSRRNSWSGRKTTITDSTNSTVTLNDAGTLDKFDWMLPAPKSKSNYVYLGSVYVDRSEIFNFADGNGIVSQDSITLQTSHSFDNDAIAAAQTPSGAGDLTLDGVASSSNTWEGESGHLIYFTTTADETSRTVTITGIIEGTAGTVTKNVTLGNNTSVASTDRFKSIASIAIDGATTNTVAVGINGQDSIDNTLPSTDPGVPVILSGIVSPLATGVKMQLGFSSSGTSIGDETIKICHDSSNHVISQQQIDRETTTTAFNRIQANEIYTFSFFQMLYIYSSSGGLNDNNMTRKLHLNGYYEP